MKNQDYLNTKQKKKKKKTRMGVNLGMEAKP